MLEIPTSFSSLLGGFDVSPINDALIVVCAWCEQEGKTTILHALSSVDHSARAWDVQSHGICEAHHDQVLAEFLPNS